MSGSAVPLAEMSSTSIAPEPIIQSTWMRLEFAPRAASSSGVALSQSQKARTIAAIFTHMHNVRAKTKHRFPESDFEPASQPNTRLLDEVAVSLNPFSGLNFRIAGRP